MSALTKFDRARRYVAKLPDAISGAGGHNATFAAACALVKGFDLSPEEAWPILEEFNQRARPPWSEAEMRHKLRSADGTYDDKPRGYLLRGAYAAGSIDNSNAPVVRPAPTRELPKRPPPDPKVIADFTRGVGEISEEFIARRSPIGRCGGEPHDFLTMLYEPDERVLIFTNHRSQGDFLFWIGRGGGYRLAQERSVKAVKSMLPEGGPDGIWFLTQPVSGKWEVNHKAGGFDEDKKWTRRSECNVTSWRYFVLESDTVLPRDWLRVLVNLPLPIAAIYSSGGRSIHALVRFPCVSKGEWDATRDIIRQLVCPLGADPGALTAVRLSRLPGCKRGSKMQRLLYLNPHPTAEPIRLLPEVRA